MRFFSAAGVLLVVCPLMVADMSGRKVDPTFLHRFIPDVPVKDADATATCRYKPLFGAGDSQPGILKTQLVGGHPDSVVYQTHDG
jgi:hypothetical protein